MYRCPRCANRTRVLPRSPKRKDAGMARVRQCLATGCKWQFETQENERGAINRAVKALYEREFGARMKELDELIAKLRGTMPK